MTVTHLSTEHTLLVHLSNVVVLGRCVLVWAFGSTVVGSFISQSFCWRIDVHLCFQSINCLDGTSSFTKSSSRFDHSRLLDVQIGCRLAIIQSTNRDTLRIPSFYLSGLTLLVPTHPCESSSVTLPKFIIDNYLLCLDHLSCRWFETYLSLGFSCAKYSIWCILKSNLRWDRNIKQTLFINGINLEIESPQHTWANARRSVINCMALKWDRFLHAVKFILLCTQQLSVLVINRYHLLLIGVLQLRNLNLMIFLKLIQRMVVCFVLLLLRGFLLT